MRRRTNLASVPVYLTLGIFLAVLLFPVYWMLAASFQLNSELIKSPPNLLPQIVQAENYTRILTTPRYLTYFKNSIIVSSATVALTVVLAIFAGYAFSRFKFRSSTVLLTTILSTQMFPNVAILIGLFAFFSSWGLINTYTGLILANVTLTLPFSIWFLKAFFDTVPLELEEAAFIDGASRLRILFGIVVPLMKPGILAVAIYSFLLSWDDFLYAFTITTQDAYRTVPVGIALSFIGEFEYNWAGMMALSVAASLPMIAIFIFLQRYMISGLTQGAVKG